ncbi:hypothetical protein BCR34DRAFT_144145 [Clohesyomyces aquaticus]|uniref:Uncharacterized protein n=1 Tax=Clohesyomyces aquaticus TaxID=1231657 RepID=A0A1Y2A0K1_9PLEO|nr:hypothetical protein BCR34DRAFT_144145 [Clohesyomyces aquaticus]
MDELVGGEGPNFKVPERDGTTYILIPKKLCLSNVHLWLRAPAAASRDLRLGVMLARHADPPDSRLKARQERANGNGYRQMHCTEDLGQYLVARVDGLGRSGPGWREGKKKREGGEGGNDCTEKGRWPAPVDQPARLRNAKDYLTAQKSGRRPHDQGQPEWRKLRPVVGSGNKDVHECSRAANWP